MGVTSKKHSKFSEDLETGMNFEGKKMIPSPAIKLDKRTPKKETSKASKQSKQSKQSKKSKDSRKSQKVIDYVHIVEKEGSEKVY